MKRIGFLPLFILIFIFSCGSNEEKLFSDTPKDIQTFISLIEHDFELLEQEIEEIEKIILELFSNKAAILENADKLKYKIEGTFSNAAPNADPNKSTLYISSIAVDKKAIEELIYLTNPLDTVFKKVLKDNDVITQVYFNSGIQLNRLYPPYDARTMVDPDLDITSFNFYYEADEKHNPNRALVWVDEIYIDPVGKGWVLSLLNPIYFEDQLKMVLAFDISINSILENYLANTNRQLIIIDQTGTVVAGKSKAIEALSLPPLKNHTYLQTITLDSFRPEEYNLFKSKSREVRKMISNFMLAGATKYDLEEGMEIYKVKSYEMEKLNWLILDVAMK
jgi:ribosomal protein L22